MRDWYMRWRETDEARWLAFALGGVVIPSLIAMVV